MEKHVCIIVFRDDSLKLLLNRTPPTPIPPPSPGKLGLELDPGGIPIGVSVLDELEKGGK